MSNRDGILDSHPSERVKMPPELAAFDRWDADPNDLAKWEAAMAALAPAAGAGGLRPMGRRSERPGEVGGGYGGLGPGRRSRQFQRHRQSLSQQVEARVPSVVRPSPVSTPKGHPFGAYGQPTHHSLIH